MDSNQLNYEQLEKWTIRAAEWTTRYYKSLDSTPVRASTNPGAIAARIPEFPPETPERMEEIFADFEDIVPSGMTHWQHPRFFAYFNANASPASILAEQLISSMSCNCMLWQTSPAGTEIESRMIDWFRQAVGLPEKFSGVIQHSATDATLCAVLTMRERALTWKGLKDGLFDAPRIRIYASRENHSSILKAVRLAGIGESNLVHPPTRANRSVDPLALGELIRADLARGYLPAGVVCCVGGTAAGAVDDLQEVLGVAKEFNLYTHVDAAWAGSAMVCPEFRWIWKGVDHSDSIVVNPSKWLGGQMDCTVHLLANPGLQSRTVGLRPDYLRTDGDEHLTNFNELTVALGRRFRSLKLWFLFRAHGLEGLREIVRQHVEWIHELADRFENDPDFDVSIRCPLALFGFRFVPGSRDADQATDELLRRINDDGRIYLTKAIIDESETIRVTAGTYLTTRDDVLSTYQVVREIADTL